MNTRENVIPGKIFRHYKGNEYIVLYIAKHTETHEDMVVYKALYGEGLIWVRPLEMFVEKVEVNGKIEDRFQEK